MKKNILIAGICLFLANAGFAQDLDTTSIKLDEIIISENRIQIPYAEQSRSISLIGKEVIAKSPAISVPDLLHYVSGVDVRTRGANGVQADIGIRGGTFDQTLILVNGVKISDPQTGHHSMNLPVNLGSIDRIEVLKGPGARTFGQNAFSGAINIVTARPKSSFLKIGAQGGDFALWGANAAGALVTDSQSHYLSGSYDQSAGYKHNTDYKMLNLFYNGEIDFGKGGINILAGFTDRAFGANGFYSSPDYTEQYESIQTGLAAISYKILLGNTSFETRAYYRQNNDEYIFIRDNPEFYKNNHINRTLGIEFNSVIPHTNATTGLGLDINRVTLESNNLGSRERNAASMFIEHRMEFFNRRINITPGIQINYYSDFGLNALPGIDMGYSIKDNLTLFSSIGYTYRVPTFTDMYYSDPANVGNPALLPEYAWNFELGIKTRGANFVSAQASVFYRSGNNMIDWVRASDSVKWQPVNRLFLEMVGLDTDISFDLASLNHAKNPLFDSFSINYTYIYSRTDDVESYQSRYALENLRHQLRGSLILSYGSKIKHSISAGYYDRVNLEDYTVIDSRLMYQGEKLDVFVDVTNIFDIEYQETNLVIMPGRWFKAGVIVDVF